MNVGLAFGGTEGLVSENKRNASDGASEGLTACDGGDEGADSGSNESRFLILMLACAAYMTLSTALSISRFCNRGTWYQRQHRFDTPKTGSLKRSKLLTEAPRFSQAPKIMIKQGNIDRNSTYKLFTPDDRI
jgi:hypothetical protein